MNSQELPRKLWEHPNPKSTAMYKFMEEINQDQGLRLNETFQDLYNFSTTQRSKFWDHAFQFLSIIYSGSYTTVVNENAPIEAMPHWFEGVHVNICENLLYSRGRLDTMSARGTVGKEDKKVAITEVREGVTETRHITWAQLRSEIGELTSAMKANGIKKGDRIAIVASNSFDSLKVFLATMAVGGLFSSSSTDMGTKGILDRLLQIEPKYLFMDDSAVYNGQKIDLRQKMVEILTGMASVKEFKGNVPKSKSLAEFLSLATTTTPEFEMTVFRDSFMIAYSSGTTGVPKCIVHSVGGALISSARESILHGEMTPQSVALQYTTTGWIMYFNSVMNLLPGARVILYDGSPFHPDATTFIKLIGDQKVTKLGTSPRWMSELQKNRIAPKDVADLSNLRMVTSTGTVLNDQQFEWFYDVGFPQEVHLANISGGTDIAGGCFGLENPLTPAPHPQVYVGGTQGPSIGTPISVYSTHYPPSVPVPAGESGDLVATAAFPNMPTHFYNDLPPSTPASKYHSAYFSAHAHVWTHGDFVSFHPVTGQLLFHGRSDGVLNPSGVRFGSAEIYTVIDANFSVAVAASLVVGQRRMGDVDERLLLFLQMREGQRFTSALKRDVRTAIRQALSPRHVPTYIFETREIPVTINLKKVELPVKQIVSGKRMQVSGTLLNPKSLNYYYQFAKIEDLVAAKGGKAKL